MHILFSIYRMFIYLKKYIVKVIFGPSSSEIMQTTAAATATIAAVELVRRQPRLLHQRPTPPCHRSSPNTATAHSIATFCSASVASSRRSRSHVPVPLSGTTLVKASLSHPSADLLSICCLVHRRACQCPPATTTTRYLKNSKRLMVNILVLSKIIAIPHPNEDG